MIDFKKIVEKDGKQFPGGIGMPRARVYQDATTKVCISTIKPGCSIGEHVHEDTNEVIYVVSGTAKYLLDGKEEILHPGDVHICPKGHRHQGFNVGNDDLVIYCVINHVI